MPLCADYVAGSLAFLERNTTTMIARLLRLVLLLQLLAAVTFSTLIYQRLLPRHAGWSVAIGIATVVLVRLAITANSFRLARRYRSAPPDNVRIHPGTAIRLFFTEFFSSMLSSSWTMAFCAFSKRTINDPVGLPVLLVHGYGCNSGYWHVMSKALTAARISHHAVTLEPLFASIDDYLPALHQSITELLDESASTRLILVGHSMGGLVCRAYLRDYDSASVAKVITIGSPHRGTALANSGIGKNVQQMAMHFRGDHAESSTWLRQLGESETTATRALIVSIYSHHDNIIAPQRSAHLDGASNIAVDAIGHVTLAMHKQVQQHVITQIVSTG
jgi:triacylglycerol lipase